MLLKDSEYDQLGIDARKIEKQLSGLQKSVYSVNNIRETKGQFSQDETDCDTESTSSY